MKHKYKLSLILMIIAIVFLGVYNFKDGRVNLQKSSPVSNISQNVELMAILENEMKKEELDSSQTSSDEPGYTQLYPDLYTVYNLPQEMDKDKKIAYLTFDDGPSDNTYKILDILEKNNVKATFFVVGSNITDDYEDCLKRMINEGHTIGVHCYNHSRKKLYISVEHFLDDFNNVYNRIYEATGKHVNLYRFPWGSSNAYNKKIKDALIDELDRRGFTCYDWTTSADDAVGRPTAYSMKRNIEKDLKRCSNYPIILMHDGMSNNLTVKTLPDIIKMLSNKGYEFDTLDNREPYVFPW